MSYRILLRNKLNEVGWQDVVAKVNLWAPRDFEQFRDRIDDYQRRAEIDLLDYKEGREWADGLAVDELQNPLIVSQRLLELVNNLPSDAGFARNHLASIQSNLLMTMGSMDEPTYRYDDPIL